MTPKVLILHAKKMKGADLFFQDDSNVSPHGIWSYSRIVIDTGVVLFRGRLDLWKWPGQKDNPCPKGYNGSRES